MLFFPIERRSWRSTHAIPMQQTRFPPQTNPPHAHERAPKSLPETQKPPPSQSTSPIHSGRLDSIHSPAPNLITNIGIIAPKARRHGREVVAPSRLVDDLGGRALRYEARLAHGARGREGRAVAAAARRPRRLGDGLRRRHRDRPRRAAPAVFWCRACCRAACSAADCGWGEGYLACYAAVGKGGLVSVWAWWWGRGIGIGIGLLTRRGRRG